VNANALREITDDSGGRTEIVRTGRDLDPATANIADELSRRVLTSAMRRTRRRTAAGTRSGLRRATRRSRFAPVAGTSPRPDLAAGAR
jgi:hypothetical protein